MSSFLYRSHLLAGILAVSALSLVAQAAEPIRSTLADRPESVYRITLRNARPEPVKVVVLERIPGDWEMLDASHAHQKPVSDRARWQITPPARGKWC